MIFFPISLLNWSHLIVQTPSLIPILHLQIQIYYSWDVNMFGVFIGQKDQ